LQSLTKQERTCTAYLHVLAQQHLQQCLEYMQMQMCLANAHCPNGQDIVMMLAASCRLVPPASILQPTHLRTQMDTPGFPSMPLLVKGK